MIYVLHDNDADGFGAAFAAWLKFGDSAHYIPVKRGEPVPPTPDASALYIVDFNYKRDVMLQLQAELQIKGATITLIDHHATAQQELGDLPFCVFDTTKSAAVLAWQYFHPNQSVPLFFAYIQDADLYTWKLPFSREVSEALASWPMDFDTWASISGIDVPDRDFVGEGHCIEDLIKDGEVCLRYAQQMQQRLAQNYRKVQFTWGANQSAEVPVVNSPVFQSEICRLLLDGSSAPFAACYYNDDGNEIWGLRSVSDFNVSDVAKDFGGGGHPRAAGFRVKHVAQHTIISPPPAQGAQ